MDNKERITPVSSLGEFGLIEHLTKNIEIKNRQTIKGIGDDAAVLEYAASQLVVTTDLLMEGIHFNLMYVPLKHLGYKRLCKPSEYCHECRPRQITVSIGCFSRFSVESIEELYRV